MSNEQMPPLERETARAVLAHLGVAPGPPDLRLLDRLVYAYKARVPWDTTTRIAKRLRIPDTAACPRWPEEFWSDAVQRGGGGTCYESNYALFGLLRTLGYRGYLTLNDMTSFARPGCHSAIVIVLDGERWLVDVGLGSPVTPLSLTAGAARLWPAPEYRCVVQFGDSGRTEVNLSLPSLANATHDGYVYTLVDTPVADAAYRRALTEDYGPDGLFLDQVILAKMIDGRLWRFTTNRRPLALWCFDGAWTEHPITGDVAAAVARHFAVDEATVRTALHAIITDHQSEQRTAMPADTEAP